MNGLRTYHREIISGILLGLAQQPLHLGFLAWFALIPWISVLDCRPGWRRILASGFILSFTYTYTTIFWLLLNIGTTRPVAALTLLAASALMGLNGLFTGLLWRMAGSRLAALPFAWITVEYLRSSGAVGFPWISLANTQTEYLLPIQNAELTGIFGISFWIVLVNVMLYRLLQKRDLKRSLLLAAVFLYPWLTGALLWWQAEPIPGNPFRVAVVQPNIHLSLKWRDGAQKEVIAHLLDVSAPFIREDVDLIIWPETAPAVHLLRGRRSYLRQIQKRLSGGEVKLLTGIPHYDFTEDREYKNFNSVALISANGIHGLYHKILLVPMAEYIPLSEYFPALKKLNLGQANFTHGEEYTIFKTAGARFGAGICFESTFPQFSRQYAQRGIQFIAYVVNDGWYETPPEPQQHARQLVFRAIETRKPMLRSANTGISMVVDPRGNITHQLPLNAANVIQADIIPQDSLTFYTRFGDVFTYLAMLALLIGIIQKRLRRI